jgi:hypothetical protein
LPEDVARLWAAGAVASDGEHLLPLLGIYPRSAATQAHCAADAGASARTFAKDRPVMVLPAAHLADADTPAELPEGPLAGLRRRFTGVPGVDLERLLAGEVARLAARGAVDRSSWA